MLGVDGTLATVVGKDSPARGKVQGKTGTYTDENRLLGRTHLRAKSLAGVMTTAKGKTLVFTIFVNDVPLPTGVTATREGKVDRPAVRDDLPARAVTTHFKKRNEPQSHRGHREKTEDRG